MKPPLAPVRLQDDWYVLSSSITGDLDTDHVFVYYRGQNDAW
jgi:hypothetical protein